MPNQPEMTIREARPDDVDVLVRFNAAMAKETEDKSLDIERLTRGVKAIFESPEKGFYMAAEAGGCVVGSLLITYEWSDWRNATFWWIQSVYVKPDWRRRGIYRAMHDWVHAAARSRPDVCGIRLYVDLDNEIAQNTYANLGMVRAHYYLFEIDFVYRT